MGQPQKKIKYTALQRRALLAADLETGRLLVVNDQGHTVHLAVRRALVAKGLLTFVSLDHYELTELGAAEAGRLQAEQASKRRPRALPKSRKSPGKAGRSEPQRATVSRS
jgi:hypothetical protein